MTPPVEDLAATPVSVLDAPESTNATSAHPLGAHASREVDRGTALRAVSAVHFDEERSVVFGVLFDEALAWVHGPRCAHRLLALYLFERTRGVARPHPLKDRRVLALLAPARVFGVGLVVVRLSLPDLDERSIGFLCIGRLRTTAEPRVDVRRFVLRDLGPSGAPIRLHSRHPISLACASRMERGP